MKKKVLICASILLISALSFSFFTACDKDTDSHLEVTVYDVTGKILQPNAYVRAFTDNGTVELTGFTEGDGVFKTDFAAPGVFNLYVIKEFPDSAWNAQGYHCYLDGNSSVRLKEGETVATEIRLGSTYITTKDTLYPLI